MLNNFNGSSVAGNAVNELAEKFNRLGIIGVTAVQNIANKLTNDLTSALKSVSIDQVTAGFSKYEDKLTSVQTIMSATTTTWEEDAAAMGFAGTQMEYVSGQLDKLNWFTDETSYSFTDMTSNIGKFTSQGVKLSDATRAMEGIATWAAISGQNAQSASRAMYNMSQALGVGAVKLMDWKSIENANMATVEFKQTAMDTAVALGTLTKEGEKYYTLNEKGQKDLEVTTQNFSQTLQKAWFTSDVLMKTLDQYGGFATEIGEVTAAFEDQNITTTQLLQGLEALEQGVESDEYQTWLKKTGLTAEEITPYLEKLGSAEYELGRRAFKAAQEAKTFTEALDATKDAVSTAWMNVFEHIFGNYEEAKVLWTDLANNLYTLFAEPVFLIDDLLDNIGAAEKIRGIINSVGDVAEAFEKNFLAKRDEILSAFTDIYEYVSWVFKSIKDFVSSIIKPIQEAFRDIFPKQTFSDMANGFARVSFYVQKFFDSIKLSETGAENLKRTFRGVFAVFDILKEVVSAVIRVISNFSPALREMGEGFLSGTGAVGDFIVKIRDSIKENDTFYKVFKKIGDVVVPIFKKVFEWAGKVAEGIVKLFEAAKEHGIIDAVANAFGKLGDKLSSLPSFFESISGAVSKVWNFLKTVGEGIKTVAINIWNNIKSVFNQIKEFISGIDFSSINFKDILTTGIGAGAGIGLISVFKSIKEFFDSNGKGLLKSLESIGDKLESILGSIKKAIQGFTNDLNASAILKIAAALLVLAIALAAFTALANVEGVSDGLLLMTAALTEMITAVAVLDKYVKGKVAASAAALLILAVSMLVLAGALAAFSAIAKMDTFEKGLLAFSGVLLEMVLALKALSDIGPEILASAGALLILSASMLLLAVALAAFCAIALMPTFMDGLLAMAGVLAGAVIALKALSDIGPEILAAAGALLLLSASMLLLAIALAAFAAVAMMPTFMDGLIAMGASLLVAVVALKALSDLGPQVLAGAAAILILSAAMLVLAAALAAFALVAMMPTFMDGLIVMAAGLLVLVVALIALADVGVYVLIGAAALIVASAALIVFAAAIAAVSLVLPLLGAGLEALCTSLINIGQQIVDLVFNIIDQAAEALVTIGDAIGRAVEALFTGIGGAIEALGTGLGSAIQAISEGIGEGIKAIGEGIGAAIEAVLESIGTGIGKGLEAIGTGIEKIGDSVSAIGSGIGDVGDGIRKFGEGVRSLSGVPWLDVAAGLNNINSPLKNISKINLNSVNSSISGTVSAIQNLSSTTTQLAQVGQQSIEAFVSAFSTGVGKASQAATEMAKAAATAAYQYSYWSTSGRNDSTAFVNGISSGSSAASSAGYSLASSGARGANSLYSSFYSAGSNAAQGFINGINANAAAAYNAGANVGNNAANGMRMSLQEKSPSKLTYQYGKYFDEGFVEGVEDYSKSAADAASDMALMSAGKVSDALANAISNDYANPVIRPTLDLSGVSAGASQISSMFGNQTVGVNGRYNGSAGLDGIGSAQSIVNNINIYPQPNQSVDDIASAVERRLNMTYYQRKAAGLS